MRRTRSPFRPLMDRADFEKLVEEAVAGIPGRFKKLIENVAVMVEDDPPPGRPLLGLYHGVPFKHRGPYYGNLPPDVIVIYKRPIERITRSDEEIKNKVREVVLHEIGHYFGLEEDELREIEDYIRKASRGDDS
jgi:predicted Zn-dependent protease with MMP-like domain